MQIQDLGSLSAGTTIDTDLVIIGGGPAGLTIAREFFGTSTRVLLLESGRLEENPRFTNLAAVESVGEPKGEAQARKRIEFHGANSASWSSDSQTFGARCRVLGGSTHAWAGKSAAFDDIDFAVRKWVPYSGWPFGLETLNPYLDRAAEVLNLGPNCYDDRLWELMRIAAPQPQLDPSVLKSFFWQFARSRIDKLDIMRFGPEFVTYDAPNVRVLLNATVTRIDTNETGMESSGSKSRPLMASARGCGRKRRCSRQAPSKIHAYCSLLTAFTPTDWAISTTSSAGFSWIIQVLGSATSKSKISQRSLSALGFTASSAAAERTCTCMVWPQELSFRNRNGC